MLLELLKGTLKSFWRVFEPLKISELFGVVVCGILDVYSVAGISWNWENWKTENPKTQKAQKPMTQIKIKLFLKFNSEFLRK